MDEISPDTNDNQLLANALECVAAFANTMLAKLETRPKAALNQAIFAGARIQVIVQLNPHPEIRGTVESDGKIEELFSVTFPDEMPPAILN